MAGEFRLVLIILGALVIGALFFHGLWTVRKNSGKPRHRYYDERESEPGKAGSDGFDEFGIGKVRVVKSASPKKPPAEAETEYQAELPFDEPKEPEISFSALADDEPEPVSRSKTPDTTVAAKTETAAEEPSEVLILYVLLPEHKEMKGSDLLSALLPLGFKYGDMDIFHRHLDSAGSGDVLFSLANMFNPGTFDIENMDKVTTRGLSLFMTLPGPGEALQNFNLMHNAAKKLAEEFGGQVLDGQRSVLTVQTVRHYVDKIREFQRQRLIRG
ncbi:cell division protein ZipA [Chromatiaceae bacterium AAb-1]|nr:cell division protein ZipA [Chromatiaceae bacterium AAb-1]